MEDDYTSNVLSKKLTIDVIKALVGGHKTEEELRIELGVKLGEDLSYAIETLKEYGIISKDFKLKGTYLVKDAWSLDEKKLAEYVGRREELKSFYKDIL